MEAGRHLRRDDDAESRDDSVNIACVFAAGIEDDIFAAKPNQIHFKQFIAKQGPLQITGVNFSNNNVQF